MQGNELFEYAVIRLVPRMEREEFLNVGLVLYCRGQRFLAMRFTLDTPKLQAFCASCESSELAAYLHAFELICKGDPRGGPIALLPVAERFRWLTAKRSTVIQTSAVHPGLCADAEAALDRLHAELVL
ncbi:DUF3037 domain-containing protein [Parapedobacter sp. DT-150]|uniref:DUF3037 domain-containing protein n=1 Tax=Parapedobacter sp. DT-150 TaxID=3396162 RepID=UPI003F1CA8C2